MPDASESRVNPRRRWLCRLLSLALITSGIGWIVLTGLEPGRKLSHGIWYSKELIVAILAIPGIYWLWDHTQAELGLAGDVGYPLLLGGLLIVAVPKSLDGIVFDVKGTAPLGNPGFMLITTVLGLLVIYLGFFLLGVEFMNEDHLPDRLPVYVFLAAFPTAIAGTLLYMEMFLHLRITYTTFTVAPAGAGLAMTGVVIYKTSSLSEEIADKSPGGQ